MKWLILFAFASISYASSEIELKWGGDLRMRGLYEKDGDAEARLRDQLRLRLGVAAQIDSDVRAELRLATAKTNRSTNQALGDDKDPGMPRRFFGLDQAFIQWSPVSFGSLYGGRHKLLNFRPGGSQLILDEDLNLEGGAAVVNYEFRPGWKINVVAGSAEVHENYDFFYSSAETDNQLNYGQIFAEWKEGNFKTTGGIGFFNWVSVQGKNFSDLVAGGAAWGNSESDPGVIAFPYLVKEAFLQTDIKWDVGTLSIFGDYIVNNEAPISNQGFWIGGSWAMKSWTFLLAWEELDSDATLAAFTDSDFVNGRTATHGAEGVVRWAFAKNLSLKLVEFYSKTPLNKDYHRTHLDLTAEF